MNLIDSHCHLDFPIFAGQLDSLISAAANVGVSDFVVPGVQASGFQNQLNIAEQYNFKPALGLHPCFLSEHQSSDIQLLEQYLQNHSAIKAVGEIGLDFYLKDADQEFQLFYFKAQLDLAKKYNLPVILHVRKAHDQVLKLLRESNLDCAGIVHAYSGSEQQAYQYIDLGFKLGFGGSLSYDRALKLRRLARELPLSALVLETDSPDMPLMGLSDSVNQPKYIYNIAELVADLRQQTVAEVAQATTANLKQLLKI